MLSILENLCIIILLFISIGNETFAQDITVNFTANIRDTTCDMRITGGSGDGKNNTIPIGNAGKTSLDKILAGDSGAATSFSLDIVSCPDGLTSLKTTISGTPSSYVPTAIANGINNDSAANFIGVQIFRSNGGNPFVINSDNDQERLVWTSSEISSKTVDLIAKLVPTNSSNATTGEFSAVATFNFTYQ